MKIRNKFKDFFIDTFRVICLMIIAFLILYHDWNINASVIFGLVALIGLIFSSKTYIEIESEEIKIHSKRLLNIISKTKRHKKNDIQNIEYFPFRVHFIILILPGIGGLESSRLKITKTNGESEEYVLTLKKSDVRLIDDFINKNSRIKPSR